MPKQTSLREGPLDRTNNSQATCILGMHRSGTSALAQVVHLLGADIGKNEDLIPAEPANAAGYWERRDVN